MAFFQFGFVEDDCYKTQSVERAKGEQLIDVRRKAKLMHDALRRPGVTELEVYLQTVTITFYSSETAKKYTYVCENDFTGYDIIWLTDSAGNAIPDEWGCHQAVYIAECKLMTLKDLERKAQEQKQCHWFEFYKPLYGKGAMLRSEEE